MVNKTRQTRSLLLRISLEGEIGNEQHKGPGGAEGDSVRYGGQGRPSLGGDIEAETSVMRRSWL